MIPDSSHTGHLPVLKHPPARVPASFLLALLAILNGFCAPSTTFGQSPAAAGSTDDSPPAATPAANAEPDSDTKESTDEGEGEAEEEPLPKLTEMELPSAATLLHERPLDWIVLQNQDVIVARPVYPRPRTLQQVQQRIDDSLNEPRAIGREALAEQRQRRLELNYIDIFLPGDDEEDEESAAEGYRLHRRYIREVIHHEDLMLRRAAQLIESGELLPAWELLYAVRQRLSTWPGLAEAEQSLLFQQAVNAEALGRFDEALVFLEQLAAIRPKYPNLPVQFGQVTDALIAEAAGTRDWHAARHLLQRLQVVFPAHPLAREWSAELARQANWHAEQAAAASSASLPDLAARQIETSARIWPEAADRPALYRELLTRWPRLHVGLIQPAGDSSGWFLPRRIDESLNQLVTPRLFAVNAVDVLPHDGSPLLEDWEPTDLGRQARFQLRQARSPGDPVPLVSANSVVRTLQIRTQPGHPLYDERLDSMLRSARVLSPWSFELTFHQTPRRIAALLRLPLVAETTGSARPSAASGSPAAEQPLLSRFVPSPAVPAAGLEPEEAWRRTVPEPPDRSTHHVAEVILHRYPDLERAVRGLLRGEITCLPHVSPHVAQLLATDGRFLVRRAALPVTHTIQFNPRSAVAKNRELRRALAAALDRQQLLEDVVLPQADASQGKVVSAPFATQFRGTSLLVDVRPVDRALAAGLTVVAAAKFPEGLPELRLLVEPGELPATVADELISQWQRVGLHVRRVAAGDNVTREDGWDLLYRTGSMTDPAAELWPWLTLRPTARVEDLAWLPHWLRHELIALEQATDEQAANMHLNRLHRQLRDEAHVIPLWEIAEYTVYHRNIRGIPNQPVFPFQQLADWTFTPAYPDDVATGVAVSGER